MNRRRGLVALVGLALVVGLLPPASPAVAAAGREEVGPTPAQRERSVPVQPVAVRPPTTDPSPDHVVTKPPPVAWPSAVVAEVDLSAAVASGSGEVRVGELPVWVSPPHTVEPDRAAPARLKAEVLDQPTTTAAGVRGVLVRLSRVDSARAAGRVRMAVDYGAFRDASGGDWASRLRLVSVPECALATPDKQECQPNVVAGQQNDNKASRVAGDVAADGGLFAVMAGPSGAAGDYKATDLAPSATWSAGGSSGDFTWSYPLRVPPANGGQAPEVALSYSSGSVDGRTASTNNQPTWVGEGFDLQVGGHVERRYKACADDLGGNNGQTKTGDLCWGTDNAFITLGGKSTELIRNDGNGTWRLKNDDGSKVERLNDSDNADFYREYWKITTIDGTQYFFGRRGASNSTWTVPVFGNHTGEPCKQTAFADSWCDRAYRWNLDHVVDPHGNTSTLYYRTDSNLYGRNRGQAAHSYHRAGWLERIEYGTHREAGGAVPAVVLFTAEDRCVTPGPTCVSSNPSNWPDVPWDQKCDSGSCATKVSPTFWSTKRLAKATTRVWGGTGYRDVDSWTLVHQFLRPGDGTSPVLWLDAIRRTGHVGGNTTIPEVNFNEERRANRVDGIESPPLLPLERFRIANIRTETGGELTIQYTQPECRPGQMPSAPEWNTMRCFPVYWTPEGRTEPLRDWFHKYVVTSVSENDLTGGGRPKLTNYEYLTTPSWHYDDEDGLVPPERKSWSQWRGYQKVGVVSGDGFTGGGVAGAARLRTVTTYLQGMDDDFVPGGRRDIRVADSQGGSIEDHEHFQGMGREQVTYKAAGDNTIVSATITDPWLSVPTSTNNRPWGAESAFLVNSGSVRERVALEAGGYRNTQVINTFEQGTGLLDKSSDLGDISTAADDRCTDTTYARNAGAWMLNYVSRVETVGVACTVQATYPQDLLSDVRTFYDNGGFGAAPAKGDVTRTEQAASWSGTAPRYVTVSRARHDPWGRVVESWDASGERSTMVYTAVPNAAGPVARVTATNPLGHTVTSDVEPALALPTRVTDANQRKTEVVYDGLGRLTRVWLPGRDRASFPQSPNSEYEYRVQTGAANVVTSKTLRPDGVSYNHSYAFFDGLLRPRQTQVASPGLTGGRIMSESFYDSLGLVWKTSGPYFNGAPPDVALVTPVKDTDVETQTLTTFDGVGRAVRSAFRSRGIEKWFTTTSYGGDRVHVNPPAGATATTAVTDARGQTTELRQYSGAAPTSGFQSTRYSYSRRGELASVTDPASNVWTYSYDLRGLKIQTPDPDKGATTFGFDDAGRLTSTRDARDVTVAYGYDRLGRKTAVHEGSLAGPKRAEWVFDTLPGGLGLPTSSTRFEGGHGYVSGVVGYDAGGRPTGSAVTIPAAEGALAGTYRSTMTYRPDGSPATVGLPTVPGLADETLSIGYNTVGLPATLGSGVSTYVTGTGYSDLGELGQLTLQSPASPKQLWQSFVYERGTRRLSQILLERQVAGSLQQANVFHSYDPAGNLIRVADKPAVAGLTHDSQCFRYDHLRRLTEAWSPSTDNCVPNPTTAALGGPAPYWHSYQYDTVGNRTSEVQHAAGGDTTRTYTYPASGHAHALASVTTTKPGASTTTDSFGYNQTGDTTSRQVAGQPGHILSWDPEGRLASDSVNGQSTTFVYDAAGGRLLRRDPTHTTLYLGDGTELRSQRPSGPVVATRYYTHAGRTIATRTGATVTWLAADRHGTHNYAINAATLDVTRRRSLPFGAPRGPQPTWPGERGFVGGTQDASTGLTHLGAREYDPTLGRFISVDPLMDLADPQQMHGYTYANNNPTTHSDPTGLRIADCEQMHTNCTDGGRLRYSDPGEQKRHDSIAANAQARHQRAYRLGKPALKNKPTDQVLNAWRNRGYQGSPEFTWADALEFADTNNYGYDTLCGVVLSGAASDACMAARPDMYDNGISIHVFLDLIGLIPIVGEPADLINAIIYASEGNWVDAGISLSGVLPMIGSTGTLIRLGDNAVGAFKAMCSFTGDTKVLMADGSTKPISEVKVGDEVLAADPETGEQGPRTVTAVWAHEDTVIDLATEDGAKVTTTEDHPFYNTTDKQWQQAQDLDPGDQLHTASGRLVLVGGLRYGTQRMDTAYNLTVQDVHTYHVGVGGESVLVHNIGCDDWADAFIGAHGGVKRSFAPPGPPGTVFPENVYRLGPGDEAWFHHTVVVRDGKVFDQFTGPSGMIIDRWKQQWGDLAEEIDFGF